MCGPALGLVGAAVSAVGSMAAANAQAANHEYNARVEKINARSRRWEGLQESERISEKYEKLQGQQTAGLAKGGVDPFFGSALQIFTGTRFAEGTDQNTNYLNNESQAIAHENKAKQEEYQAKTTRQAGAINAASGFLSGLGKAAGSGGGFGSTLMIG